MVGSRFWDAALPGFDVGASAKRYQNRSSVWRVDGVFYDVYSTVTGKKLFTIQGKLGGLGDDPQGCLRRTAWLTERYLIIPLGKHRERCVVCEFDARRERGGTP